MSFKNAFTAFDLPADLATIETLRTDIALALRNYIERTGISQEKAGETFGLKQSVVSAIVRGDTKHLSVERLIKAMVKAKLYGYAEWGESAEDAEAGTGYRPNATSTVIYTAEFVALGDPWNKSEVSNAGRHPAKIVKSRVDTAPLNKVN